MSTNESSEYARWLALANDPNESEQARLLHREKMTAYLHLKLREAFTFAAAEPHSPEINDPTVAGTTQ